MTDGTKEIATVGGGCFWCVEAAFLELRGVERVASGYAGGHVPSPSYHDVCGGETGHAEVVQVTFDPSQITYRELLEAFFTVHDPTTPNRQGADVGTQYRSIVFYHHEEQHRVAKELIAELEREDAFGAPIVTEVVPFTEFYPAEAYHQDYYRRNPLQPYCMVVVRPKVAKLRKALASKLRTAAIT